MIARALETGSRALADELAPKFLAEGAPDDVTKQLREMMRCTSLNGIIGALAAMRDRPDNTPLLRTLATVPTLLLIGERDARTPRASMQAMADRIAGARFEVVPDAGHLPPLENPATVVSRLSVFLDELAQCRRCGPASRVRILRRGRVSARVRTV